MFKRPVPLGPLLSFDDSLREKKLLDTKIVCYFNFQIVCGYAHTMAVSDEGHLYAWGANS